MPPAMRSGSGGGAATGHDLWSVFYIRQNSSFSGMANERHDFAQPSTVSQGCQVILCIKVGLISRNDMLPLEG